MIYIPPNTIHPHFNASPDRPGRMIFAIDRIFKSSGLNDLEQLEDAPEFKAGILLTAEMVAKYLKSTEKTAKTALTNLRNLI